MYDDFFLFFFYSERHLRDALLTSFSILRRRSWFWAHRRTRLSYSGVCNTFSGSKIASIFSYAVPPRRRVDTVEHCNLWDFSKFCLVFESLPENEKVGIPRTHQVTWNFHASFGPGKLNIRKKVVIIALELWNLSFFAVSVSEKLLILNLKA